MFYFADYLKDTRCLSLAARGAWMDCLALMWSAPERGELTMPMVGFARMFGCPVDQAEAVINELAEMQTCDRVTRDDGKVRVVNRRMMREAAERKNANIRQKRYIQHKKLNGDANSDADSDAENDGEVTPALSYSYSNSFPPHPPPAGGRERRSANGTRKSRRETERERACLAASGLLDEKGA
mgnify:CR=1 FL=1